MNHDFRLITDRPQHRHLVPLYRLYAMALFQPLSSGPAIRTAFRLSICESVAQSIEEWTGVHVGSVNNSVQLFPWRA